MGKTLRATIIAVMLSLLFVVTGCGGNVVATVNGDKITDRELSQKVNEIKSQLEGQGVDFSGEKGEAFMDSLQKQTLEQMIYSKLMLQEAKKLGKLSPEQVQEKLKPLKEQFPSEDDFNKLLGQIKMSEEEVAYVLNLEEQVTKDVVPVSEEELKKYYEENIEQFSHPEQLQVRHILFFVDEGDKGFPVQRSDAEAKKIAEDAIAQLKQGKDFAELAGEKSEDTATKANGGIYTFSKGDAVKEFSDAAYNLKPGEYTEQPVKTEYGYHIIKMEKVIPAGQDTFDEVKEALANQLLDNAKQEKFSQFMQEASNNAKIVNKLAEKQEGKSNN